MSRRLLEVKDLQVHFRISRGPFRRPLTLKAVNHVDLHVDEGECVALIGESGSGKSTLGKAILRLLPIHDGTLRFGEHAVERLGGRPLRALRPSMQMIFQDPYSSLDPLMTVEDSVGEPIDVHTDSTKEQRNAMVAELFERVGLAPSHAKRYPAQFSGGQRQRVSIARAIALNPQLIVCDEPLSSLDVATQNQIINLLKSLQRDQGIAFLFISHDLAASRHIADRIVVLYLGRVVEEGPTERVLGSPAHPYTQALLSADLIPDPVEQRARQHVPIVGEIPDPLDPPAGCPFVTRCLYAMDVCKSSMPATAQVTSGGSVACHLQTDGPRLEGETLPSTLDVVADRG